MLFFFPNSFMITLSFNRLFCIESLLIFVWKDPLLFIIVESPNWSLLIYFLYVYCVYEFYLSKRAYCLEEVSDVEWAVLLVLCELFEDNEFALNYVEGWGVVKVFIWRGLLNWSFDYKRVLFLPLEKEPLLLFA